MKKRIWNLGNTGVKYLDSNRYFDFWRIMMTSTARIKSIIISLCILIIPFSAFSEEKDLKTTTSHGMTLFGELKYGPDFKHFDYVNPEAPKGGTYTYISFNSTFDSLHRYIILGTAPMINMYERLMVRSGDEPVSIYGLLAENITLPDDFSWAEFKLRDIAKWHDGKPVTIEDVIFTFEILKAHGRPEYRNTYKKVAKVEKTGPLSVRFTFKEKGDRGNPYGLAYMMPVFPKHYWEGRDFTKPSLDIPLTSGPYRITKVDPGRSFVRERVKDYWGRDLAVNRGRYNFDVIKYDYYRDFSVSHEAFIAGKADIRNEMQANLWMNGYNVPAANKGYIKKEMFERKGPKMHMGLYLNLRKDKFKNPMVREALSYAYDWEWINKTLYHNLNRRTSSYFENSELEARGLPGQEELKILEPFREHLDPRVFTEEYNPPETDATPGSLRKNLRRASMLLMEAGYEVKDGRLLSGKGEQLSIEFLLRDPSMQKSYSSLIANLKLLGIEASMRMVDNTEYMQRIRARDYDVLAWYNMTQSVAPGQELRQFFGSENADLPAGMNHMGIKNPVVDSIIEKIIFAPNRVSQVAATRALDRVLNWSFYSIHLYYAPDYMIVYWDRFGRPEVQAKWDQDFLYFDTWWIDEEKDKVIKKVRGGY
ncbi:extracellular solute-binding protein [Thermodesulfobacteriota bacterium]